MAPNYDNPTHFGAFGHQISIIFHVEITYASHVQAYPYLPLATELIAGLSNSICSQNRQKCNLWTKLATYVLMPNRMQLGLALEAVSTDSQKHAEESPRPARTGPNVS